MKKKKKLLIVIIVVIFLELFLFNFRFFMVKLSGFEHKVLNNFDILNDEVVIENDNNNEEKNEKFVKHYRIEFKENVKGVKVNFKKASDENIEIDFRFSDEGEKYAFKDLETRNYNKKFKNSEYFFVNSQRNCLGIYLYMSSEGDYDLESIEINTWYYEFNLFRVISLIVIASLIIYWKDINESFDKNKKYKILVYATIIIVAAIIYGIYCSKVVPVRFYENASVDPYNLLTESILNGRVDLNYEYEGTPITQEDIDRLQELENYKDITERNAEQVGYYFDTAFYNGKYYCYYGIVPVLTKMIPFAIITGNIPFSNVPCFIYGVVLMIMVLLLYLEILKKFNIKFSNFITELGLYIVLFMATGISILFTDVRFYKAADLSGIAWGMIGIYCLLKLDNKNKILTKLLVAGLSFGLMVCSRPVYVLYFPIFVILVYKYLIENKKINLKRCLYFATPIIIIAILQMIYNYVRFHNIFEFGQFYQLTINDPSEQRMDLGMSIKGLMVYLFSLPKFIPNYPFLERNNIKVAIGNTIYVETVYGLVCYPLLWIMIMGHKLLKDKKQLKMIWIVTIIISIISFSVNTCLAGINQRYTIDVQPCIAIMSFVLWMIYLNKYKSDKRSKNLLFYISIATYVIAFFITVERVHEFIKIMDMQGIVDYILYIINHSLNFYA